MIAVSTRLGRDDLLGYERGERRRPCRPLSGGADRLLLLAKETGRHRPNSATTCVVYARSNPLHTRMLTLTILHATAWPDGAISKRYWSDTTDRFLVALHLGPIDGPTVAPSTAFQTDECRAPNSS